MDKHEKLDEALEKMREESAAASAATPPPDWGKLEQNVILRLVRQVKARRVVITVLAVIVVLVSLYLGAIKMLFPEAFEKKKEVEGLIPRWHVGDITVTRHEMISLLEDRKVVGAVYGIDDGLPQGNISLDFSIVKLNKPVAGTSLIATVHTDDCIYYFLLKGDASKNLLAGAGFPLQDTYAVDELVKLGKQMRKAWAWPIPTWPIYPAVKLICEGKFVLIAWGSPNGNLYSKKLFYGKDSVLSLQAYAFTHEYNVNGTSHISIWPDRYVVCGLGEKPLMVGDQNGYTVYQGVNRWGADTYNELRGISLGMQYAAQAMAVAPDEYSEDEIARLNEIVNVTFPNTPREIRFLDMNVMKAMVEPWRWKGWTPETKQPKEEMKPKNAGQSYGEVDGISFTAPKPGEYGGLRISKENTGLLFGMGLGRVGEAATLVIGDEEAVKVDVRNVEPYPPLEIRFDAKTEEHIATMEALAREVLAKPSVSWPANTVSKESLSSWLTQIADRRFLLRESEVSTTLRSFLRWEGDKCELLLAIGTSQDNAKDFELAVGMDGFSLLLPQSQCLINSKAGIVDAAQAEGNMNPVLTATELRQLKGCLGLLVDYLEPKAELSPVGAEDQLKFKLKESIPSRLMPGIEALAEFLQKPELPTPKKVAQPLKLDWDLDTYEGIRKAVSD
jgi:hypothetical protein